jgi:hypothetical protein
MNPYPMVFIWFTVVRVIRLHVIILAYQKNALLLYRIAVVGVSIVSLLP